MKNNEQPGSLIPHAEPASGGEVGAPKSFDDWSGPTSLHASVLRPRTIFSTQSNCTSRSWCGTGFGPANRYAIGEKRSSVS